ncbi:MAG: PAS domain S-box protein [Balneolaceae bacterium]
MIKKLNSAEPVAFFDNEPIFLYDYHTLEIIDVNKACLEKYGFTKKEFLGKRVTDLGEKYHSEFQEKVQEPSIWTHKNKKGNSFHVQLTLHPFKYQERNVQLAIAHDVSRLVDDLENQAHLLPAIESIKARIPMGMIEWNRHGKIRDWSDFAEKIFGWRFKEMAGKNLFETGILPESKKKQIQQNITDLVEQKSSYFAIESEHITKERQKIYCAWHNVSIHDQSGNLVSIYSMVEDITEKKLGEEQLRESEERFRVLTDASLVGIYMVQNKLFRYVNPRFCEICGYKIDDLTNKIDPFQLIHKDDRPKLLRLRQMWDASEIDSFEVNVRAYTKQKRVIHVKVYGSKIMMRDKPAMIGVVVDQTKEVEATTKYKKSVASYKALFDSIGDAIYIQDREGVFLEVNESVEKMYGYTKNEIIGQTPAFLSAPGKVDMKKTRELIDKAFDGIPQRFEWWGKRKNGEIFPKEIHLNPGTYFGKKVVIAIARDISEQYEQQKILKQNELLFRQLFQNAPIGIALLDERKEVQMINAGFEDIFGYTFQDINGLPIDSIIAPEERLDEATNLSERDEPFEVTSTRVNKDGNIVDVLIYGVPVILDGRTIAIYGIYVDITDRKEAEAKIRYSLKEKEVLLSEIHHRVKNNLAVITGLLELQSQSTHNKGARKVLKDSQMRINSMALIHEKLYQNETLSQIEFDKYIEELTDVIQKSHSTVERPVSLQLDVDNIQLTITQAIPCGLLLNEIVTNSFKHAFSGLNGKQPVISVSLKEKKGKIKLIISDNGQGLPDKFEKLGKKSLGLTLINTLKNQIEAEMKVNVSGGTSYSFVFEKETFNL